MKIVLAAIFWIAPHLSADTAKFYAGLITGHAENAKIDPLLVVAIIHVESRFNAKARSKTNDHGLGQVHVSSTTLRRYRGREHLLFDPARNIRLSVKLMKMWRAYHDRKCGHDHQWWTHYNCGRRVLKKCLRYGDRVEAVYKVLLSRFQTS